MERVDNFSWIIKPPQEPMKSITGIEPGYRSWARGSYYSGISCDHFSGTSGKRFDCEEIDCTAIISSMKEPFHSGDIHIDRH